MRRWFPFYLDGGSGGDSGGGGDSSDKTLSLSASERFQRQPEILYPPHHDTLSPLQYSVGLLCSLFKTALPLSLCDMIPYRRQISLQFFSFSLAIIAYMLNLQYMQSTLSCNSYPL